MTLDIDRISKSNSYVGCGNGLDGATGERNAPTSQKESTSVLSQLPDQAEGRGNAKERP